MAIARKRLWLPMASAVSLTLAVICSESIELRSFWPEFLTVASLGLLLTSLLRDVVDIKKQPGRKGDRLA
jgi:hypothetical protein